MGPSFAGSGEVLAGVAQVVAQLDRLGALLGRLLDRNPTWRLQLAGDRSTIVANGVSPCRSIGSPAQGRRIHNSSSLLTPTTGLLAVFSFSQP